MKTATKDILISIMGQNFELSGTGSKTKKPQKQSPRERAIFNLETSLELLKNPDLKINSQGYNRSPLPCFKELENGEYEVYILYGKKRVPIIEQNTEIICKKEFLEQAHQSLIQVLQSGNLDDQLDKLYSEYKTMRKNKLKFDDETD